MLLGDMPSVYPEDKHRTYMSICLATPVLSRCIVCVSQRKTLKWARMEITSDSV